VQDKFEREPDYRSDNLDNDTRLMILKSIKYLVTMVPEDIYSIKVLVESNLSDKLVADI
jgi:hypothetical protein